MEEFATPDTIVFEDVENFWMSFFPELSNISELKEMLEQYSCLDMHDIEEKYFDYTDINALNVEVFFNEIITYDLSSHLQLVMEKLKDEYRWCNFFKPIISFHAKKLYKKINESKIIKDPLCVFEQAISYIVSTLHIIAFRTLILEVNIANDEGRLVGNTSTERANYFKDNLLTDQKYIYELYKEYIELTNLMHLKVKYSMEFIIDIIANTENEINLLSEKFNSSKDIGQIQKMIFDAGDTHNKGRRVSIIIFTSNTKLIYKPRSLAIDQKYYDFVECINQLEIPKFLNLKAAKVHYSNESGWMEFIEYKNCKDEQDILSFYQRIGQLLCIMYTLNSQDFHFENLIAEADQPILIDLETLLHASLDDSNNIDATSATAKAKEIINNSVKKNLLLPTQIISNKNNNSSVDLGGLAAAEEQKSHLKSVFIKNYDRDDVQILKEYHVLEPQNNNPKINEKIIKSEDYVGEIVKGFKVMYQWILMNKLYYKEVINNYFATVDCRVLFRATSDYAQVLNTSYHPDLLRNLLDRKVFLHRIALHRKLQHKQIVSREIDDLLVGDVPFFTVNSKQTTLKTFCGENYNGFFDISVIDAILNKIDKLSEHDLERQVAFINMSFYHKTPNMGKEKTNLNFVNSNVPNTFKKITNPLDACINYSIQIGDLIVKKSISGYQEGKAERTWIGSVEISNTVQITSAIGNDLYSGNSGIALFLAYLGKITGEERYKVAATEALVPVISSLEQFQVNSEIPTGAFSGISGYFYTLFHVSRVLENNDLQKIVFDYIHILKQIVNTEQGHDVIGGLAGILGVTLAIYEKTEDQLIKNVLLEISNIAFLRLKELSIRSNEFPGVTWGVEGYTGFSHGNAGINAFLCKLYSITNNQEITDLIKESLLYERSMYNKTGLNWKKSLSQDTYYNNWCHGSAGILLSKIMLEKYGYYDDLIAEERNVCIENIKNYGFGTDYCLCHGDLGNLRILTYAADVLNDQELKDSCISTLNNFFQTYLIQSWNSGINNYKESHELMTGLSGLGYTLLQFYKANYLPEILLLS
jgi:type 2 lantibiotic biosynthesis protein LanM